MLSDDLVNELGSLIRRLESKIRLEPVYVTREGDWLTLDALENAIIGLVLLHIQLRRNQ